MELGLAAAAVSAGGVSARASARGHDIVDAQVHVGRGGIGPALETMDRLGIASTLIYEFWGTFAGGDPRHTMPGFKLPNGAWRAVNAVASEASLAYPERFASVVKVDRTDPQLRVVLEGIASTPHIKGIRVLPAWSVADIASFAAGGCDEIFGIAQDLGIPVFLFIPGQAALLRPYLARFPRLTVIVDHCGMPFANIPFDGPKGTPQPGPAYFDEVLKLAEFPNAALKWSHAIALFGPQYPTHESLRPVLRKAIAAFGAERIVWASDNTVMPGHSWGSLLNAVLDDPGLSPDEKNWILGGSARKLLHWDEREV